MFFRGLAIFHQLTFRHEALDEDCDDHGDEDDEAGGEHEGAGEGVEGLVVDDGVHGPGHELDQRADQGQAREDAAHLGLVHGLAAISATVRYNLTRSLHSITVPE